MKRIVDAGFRQEFMNLERENYMQSRPAPTALRSEETKERLVIVAGPNQGETIRLDQGEVIIGRDTTTGLCLNDESVSRKQCTVRSQGSSYLLVDFNSRNGSFVNGVPIQEKVLQPGDRIRIGCTELIFLQGQPEEPSAAAVSEREPVPEPRQVFNPADRALVPACNSLRGFTPGPASGAAIRMPIPPQPLSPACALRSGSALANVRKAVRRRLPAILAIVALAILAAVVVQVVVPKRYESTALVRLEGPVDDMNRVLGTELEMAQSDPVLRPVAERFDLLTAEKQLKGLDARTASEKRAAAIHLNGLHVTRSPNSFVIQIAYRAYDPQFAAKIANEVAQSLIAHANDAARRSFEQVATLVAQDAPGLVSKMETSANAVAEFERQLNMADPEQRVKMLTARVAQLDADLAAAQNERLRREAILGHVAGSNTVASAQAAAQDNLLNDAIQRLSAARQQFASIRAFYGDGHPEYSKAQKQVQEMEAQVQELQTGTRDRARADYQQVVAHEARLSSLVQQTKAELEALQGHALKYEHLKSEAANDKNAFESLAHQARTEAITQQVRNVRLVIAAPALVSQEPIFPRLPLNLALAIVASAILGFVVVVLAHAFDPTFSDPQDVARRLQLDVLAALPKAALGPAASSRNAIGAKAKTPQLAARNVAQFDESMRALRAALLLVRNHAPVRNVVFTSAVPGEGKSTAAAHMAIACAEAGQKTLLIDGNFRRPMLHDMFNVNNTAGLAEVLKGERSYAEAIVGLKQRGLFFMPAGAVSRRAADLLGVGLSMVLANVSPMFDLVIVDAPAVLGASEALQMAGAAEGIVLLTKANATTEKSVAEALARLGRAKANVLGVVMNQVRETAVPVSSSYAYPEATGFFDVRLLSSQSILSSRLQLNRAVKTR